MYKKFVPLIIIAALLGGFVGSLMTARSTNASVWDDVLNFFRGVPSTTPYSGESNFTSTTPVILPYEPLANSYEEAVIRAVDKAMPSVVAIVISKDIPIIEQCPYNPFGDLSPEFQQFFGNGFQFNQPCQKGTRREEVGGGSGFVIDADGLIVTNRHVVADETAEYTVVTNDGKKYAATVLARDPFQDIAVIKINATGLQVVALGDSDSLRLGQTAIAIGNSLGEFRNTVSVGSVSGLSRTITASGNGISSEKIQDVIQTDAAINPGNSGGPLLNLKGEVIGINTAIASGAQNIGFAIPINRAKRDITSVKKSGTISTPYLGVRYIIIDETIAKQQKISVDYGALVRGSPDGPGVIVDSPAAVSGVRAEDIILEINGARIDQNYPLTLRLQAYGVGDTIQLTIIREGKTISLPVTLQERPASL